MSDVPHQLPPGWSATTLREIAEIVGGVTKDAKKSAIPGMREVPYLRVANVQRGRLDLTEVKVIAASEACIEKLALQPGDILLNEGGDRDKLGRGWVWEGQLPVCIHQNHVFRARLLSREIEPLYIAHFANSAAQSYFLEQGSQTTNLASISLTKLGSLPIWLPPSREQARVVAKLDKLLSDLDAGLAELEVAQNKLQRYRQSLLKAAVEGELTAAWRAAHKPAETGDELLQRSLTERRSRWEIRQREKAASSGKPLPKSWQGGFPGRAEVDTTELPPLPQHWTWATLDMLGEIASGVAKGSKVGANAKLREVPYLRVANVQRGFLDLGEIKTILASEADIEQLALHNGDVLFNEGGDRDKLGRGWVWRSQVPECIHQNHVFRMRPFLPDMNSEFISHHGNSFGQQWFLAVGKQTTNLASINMGMLRAFPVPVPPAAEQARIADVVAASLEAADAMQASIDKALAQCTAQRQNILGAAFSGQLVPQDPADEPADELLARIRAGRSVAKPPARKQRAAASSVAAD